MPLLDFIYGDVVLNRRAEAERTRREIAALDRVIAGKREELAAVKAPSLSLEEECEALLERSIYARTE